MAGQRTMTSSALLTTALLTAVLAIIAGILGMHVLTSAHSAQSSTTAARMPYMAGQSPAAPGGEASGHDDHAAAPAEPAMAELSAAKGADSAVQCSCSGKCSSQHSMGASCIPSATAAALAAPVPNDTTSVTAQSAVPTSTPRIPWSYRPGSPSPGELSISRT
ncbi:DUF6153 family protein [Paenarthrobacter nitroguajacolicus]|uniref:DUF6153 family protein n=1 Tax=Paenarthrobacter nitroguajacolicus TaxID=211146 RepID=UPI003AEE3534